MTRSKAGNISTKSVRDYWRHVSEKFLGGTLQSHVVKCARGYYGDFEIIDHTYQQLVHEDPALARWDRFLHAQDAPVALRNRKTYFLSLLAGHMTRMKGTRLEVLNIGSGPGRDILEWFEKHGRTSVHFECVDIDPEAIAHAKALLTRFSDGVAFHQLNALRFSTQRKYQLVWSGGLFDYLPDGLFVRLLKRLLRFTAPGGEVVIGNFSKEHPTRAYMELFGGWLLIHRSPEELQQLALNVGVKDSAVKIESEPSGVNLFLHVRKETRCPPL